MEYQTLLFLLIYIENAFATGVGDLSHLVNTNPDTESSKWCIRSRLSQSREHEKKMQLWSCQQHRVRVAELILGSPSKEGAATSGPVLWEGNTETSSPIKQHSEEGALAGASFSVSDFVWGTMILFWLGAPKTQQLALYRAPNDKTNSKRQSYHYAYHFMYNICLGWDLLLMASLVSKERVKIDLLWQSIKYFC